MTDKPEYTFPPMPDDFDQAVEQYVRLRDRIKEEEDKHKQRMAPARALLEHMNNHMLDRLNVAKADSVSTQAGTVYRTSRKSATIADGAAFRNYVTAHQVFDLIDWRANAPATADFIQAHGAPPPGVNYTTAYTVGVRRK